MLSFDEPENALFLPPRNVLVDNGQTKCFFYAYESPLQTLRELQKHKRIAASGLHPELHIRRLHGIVWDNQHGLILGLLTSYINNGDLYGTTLFCHIRNGPSSSPRERWATQLDTAVAALHNIGVI